MRKLRNTKILIILSIILLIAFAGCTAKNEQTVNTSGGDEKISTEAGTGVGPDWCKTGASVGSTQQQGHYSYVIKGLTTYKGQEVCEADATFSDGTGNSGSVTYYFSKDTKYAHVIMKDASGNIINEMDVNNPAANTP